MNFQKWLIQQEDVNLGGLEPPQEHPENIAALGAMPRYDDEPLPGNKKGMCKLGKKPRVKLRQTRSKN